MKILFDHQIFIDQEYGGISRYFSELLRGLKKSNKANKLSLLFSNNQHLQELTDIRPIPFFSGKIISGKGIFLRTMNRLFSILSLLSKNFDIFHPTNYDPYFLKYIGRKPYILTVYDLIQEKFAKDFPDYAGKILNNKKITIENATHIIAISESTKNDIIDIYKITEDKITTIHLASSLEKNIKIEAIDVPAKYLLYVGNRERHKNFIFFIKAIATVLKNNKISLICAGGGKFDEKTIELLNNLNIYDLVLQVPINESKLAFLYQNAICFVFPSLYEGFGLPILEAMSMGCPVIASNTSSLPEVGGNAALYFDPNDEKSIQNISNNIINNSNLRVEMKIAGLEQIKLFSWDKTVKETIDVYNKIKY
jgi:glycosyltransferase involved in cell wall biosynthesis